MFFVLKILFLLLFVRLRTAATLQYDFSGRGTAEAVQSLLKRTFGGLCHTRVLSADEQTALSKAVQQSCQ